MSRLPRRAAAGAMLLTVLAGGWATAAAADEGPSGRLVAVRVENGQLRFVLTATGLASGTALDPAALRVTLDGTPVRATARIAAGSAAAPAAALPPRTVLVVLDTSGSMAGTGLETARRAALDFARRLPPDVRVGLVTFADRPRVAVAPTTDRSAVAAALAATRAAGGTALYDAVAAALGTLDRAHAAAGSVQHLVVLSDGKDTASRGSLDTVLARLGAARVPVDAVAFRFAGDRSTLTRMATASGGSVLSATDRGGLATAFEAAAADFDQRLDVTVPDLPADLGGRQVRVEVRVPAGTSVLATGGSAAFPAVAGGALSGPRGWAVWAVAGLVFAALLGLGLLVGVLAGGTGERRRRLAQLDLYRISGRAGEDPVDTGLRSSLTGAALAWIDRRVTARGIRQAVELDLDRAGVGLRVQEWMLLRACGCAALAAVLVVVTGSPLLAVPAAAAIGWFGSRAVLSFRASRRCAAFADGLPDLLELVAGSLKSGFSLPQALEAVVRDGSQPVAGEVSRALAGARLGVDLEDGLESVAERMRSRDLGWTVMAIRIQRMVGGNLAEVLLTTVQTMRERAQVHRQVRALTAEGRLSAYILVALPIGIGGFLFLARRDYMRPLVAEPLGLVMLAAAGVLVGLGSLWLSRLVKVEV
jgi:tight adherence protein B